MAWQKGSEYFILCVNHFHYRENVSKRHNRLIKISITAWIRACYSISSLWGIHTILCYIREIQSVMNIYSGGSGLACNSRRINNVRKLLGKVWSLIMIIFKDGYNLSYHAQIMNKNIIRVFLWKCHIRDLCIASENRGLCL